MNDALLAILSATIGAASGVLAAWVASRGSARKHRVDALSTEVGVLATQLQAVRADNDRITREHADLCEWVRLTFNYDPVTRQPVGACPPQPARERGRLP